MRNKRFQNRITAGRFTLPAAILISVACWVLSGILLPDMEVQKNDYPLWGIFHDFCIPSWGNRVSSFILYSIIGYFLIELNNAFALIRMRASVQTTIYILLISVCPSIHMLYAGDLAAITFLIALFFLFRSYQQSASSGILFNAFLCIGIGSLIFPQLTLFAPIFWIGAYSFQSLNPKSFFASLIGWSVPYWFLLGYGYLFGQMEVFYMPFLELINFQPIQFDFQPWELATLGYLFILYIASAGHCLIASYEDKIRARSYLNFLISLNFCIFIYIGLQPALSPHLLSLLLIGVSILAGHLFALISSLASNIFFIVMLTGLFLLFGFNVWMLL
ncbi:MAG: hypothetical protein LUE99_04430 [Bacteroides sp.]|nr:hypothetical protein [Bacteroides sp.]